MRQMVECTEQSSQAINLHDYEEQIEAAILGVSNGHYKSYWQAAKAEGVHLSLMLVLSVKLIILILRLSNRH